MIWPIARLLGSSVTRLGEFSHLGDCLICDFLSTQNVGVLISQKKFGTPFDKEWVGLHHFAILSQANIWSPCSCCRVRRKSFFVCTYSSFEFLHSDAEPKPQTDDLKSRPIKKLAKIGHKSCRKKRPERKAKKGQKERPRNAIRLKPL
jgi:hypothetical protein